MTLCQNNISIKSRTEKISEGGEDARRQQDRRGATNLAAVRRLAVSLLRQEKTMKRGAKNKRLKCALDPNYLLRVLTHPTI